MSFHDIRFHTDISYGAQGGPERRTDIVRLSNGHEERNSPWEHSRRRYDAGLGLRSLDDVARVLAFFEARRGPLHAFRWKDWADFKSCLPSQAITPLDQRLGIGDGTTRTFALVKAYISGDQTYLRPITRPVVNMVTVAIGHDPKLPGDDYTIDHATGLITFHAAPLLGALVSAGFEFDVPVRFDSDQLQVSMATFEAGEIPEVPVIEVRS
jgi:uncharacterized protein (TIGR02217 family)